MTSCSGKGQHYRNRKCIHGTLNNVFYPLFFEGCKDGLCLNRMYVLFPSFEG